MRDTKEARTKGTQQETIRITGSMENGAVNGYEMETPKNITIKGILSLLMESIDDDKNHSRSVISLGMGDPTAHSCFHTTHFAQEAVVDALQSDKFSGYAPTVGLPQTRR